MSTSQLVLDDGLLSYYYQIRNGTPPRDIDEKKLANFFKFFRTYLTNLDQINRLKNNNAIDNETFNRLQPSLAKQKEHSKCNLENLSKQTKLKIVLTDNNNNTNPCYVNINETFFEPHYIVVYEKNKPRDPLHQQLKHTFSSAKSIAIHDKYILNHKKSFKKLLSLFPDRCNIHCNNLIKSQKFVSEIKRMHPDFTITSDRVYNQDLHDRYIRVDDKLEIILSSGIDNLFDDLKEITCIFRCLS